MTLATTTDGFLGGALTLCQPATGHRAGTDAVLLAAGVADGFSGPLVDLGAGVGAAGLAVARRCPDARVTLVEVDPDMAALASENARRNGLASRVRVLAMDATLVGRARIAAGLADRSAAVVITNPPFNPLGAMRLSPDVRRARAHAEPPGLLDAFVRTAAAILMPGGYFVSIHRPEALPRLMAALAGRFGDIRLVPIYPKAHASAIRLIVRARRGSRASPQILAPLVLHAADGFTPEAAALHRGEAAFDWAD